MMRFGRILVLATCMVLLAAGLAHAAAYTLDVGNPYTTISGVYNGNAVTWGGGSFDGSKLNNNPLSYMFCVDIINHISSPGTYNNTTVTTNGYVNGAFVTNASKVAWLLTQYGTTAAASHGDQAIALQASIWHTIFANYSLDTSKYSSAVNTLYAGYIAEVPSADYTSNFYWISPGKFGDTTLYQGQVTPTPIPGAVWLLGSGLLGLVGIGRKRLQK